MIRKFDKSTALLLIDTQKGVNDTIYYGGTNGRRNNLKAEENIISLLGKWRDAKGQVAFTKHDSREKNSPFETFDSQKTSIKPTIDETEI